MFSLAKKVCSSKAFRMAACSGVGFSTAASLSLVVAADEAEHGMHPVQYPWSFSGYWDSYDHAALRRGHQVYQQVCSACHSLDRIHYRELVGVMYNEDEGKAMANEIEVTDGPNDEGEMFERPGKLADTLPGPYANEEAARAANGGAYPPDLSLMTKSRHDGSNYVFSLLLGYRDAPAGLTVPEGQYYNPYFPGGLIAMPKLLVDEGTEYDDGTPATESQQAKDVVEFLTWASEPEQDERKLMGLKFIFALTLASCAAVYSKRLRWAPIKSRTLILGKNLH